MKIISFIIYSFLLLFLSYVFANKALDISAFQSNIFKTGLYSVSITKILSYFVLLVESIGIILLIVNKKAGLLYTLIMLIIFTIYISFLNFTSRYEVCGCGGVLNGLSYMAHFIINICLIILSFISLIYYNKFSNEKY
ncbi:hypothetical protein DRF62_19165 [Chryseobacterium piscium]|uniref:Methylamine utilisation protein MauE domain-containing protein n=1 Tax=Chryseobacterium piscium TaxID=333702 RepID=A0A3D9BAN0_9FLAO|nr:hypothetical protein DRF62_19165 [Chryseobacterium piscium]